LQQPAKNCIRLELIQCVQKYKAIKQYRQSTTRARYGQQLFEHVVILMHFAIFSFMD